MSALEVTRGAVYDRGYRPYEGKRGRRGAATLALYKASVRRALGLRRSWRQKVAPFVLLAVVTIPAIVNVGIAYVTRNDVFTNGRVRIEIITYREYVGVSSALLLFVALIWLSLEIATRAKDELYLTYPIIRFTRGEGAAMMQESRFIGEIPKEMLEEWRLQTGYGGAYGNDSAGPF